MFHAKLSHQNPVFLPKFDLSQSKLRSIGAVEVFPVEALTNFVNLLAILPIQHTGNYS